MLVFPSTLESAAEAAGISVPPDSHDFKKEDFPHFFILCQTQLGRSMVPGEHFENAKKIAPLTREQLETMSWDDFSKLGVCP